MPEIHVEEAIMGVIVSAETGADGMTRLTLDTPAGPREVLLQTITWAERWEWLERQHEYEATLAAFDRLAAKRARRRWLARWLLPLRQMVGPRP